MKNVAGANNLVSAEKFWNFELHCEFKIGAHSNGGLGLRGRYEVQIIDDFGKPAGSHGTGALYSRIVPSVNASKAPGEWQTYDIRLVGHFVTITVEDYDRLDPGEWLNDSLVDFWMQWYDVCAGRYRQLSKFVALTLGLASVGFPATIPRLTLESTFSLPIFIRDFRSKDPTPLLVGPAGRISTFSTRSLFLFPSTKPCTGLCVLS